MMYHNVAIMGIWGKGCTKGFTMFHPFSRIPATTKIAFLVGNPENSNTFICGPGTLGPGGLRSKIYPRFYRHESVKLEPYIFAVESWIDFFSMSPKKAQF